MRGMRLGEGPARVRYVGAEMSRGEFVLLGFYAIAARVSEEESNHRIVEHPVHETIDDAAQDRLTAELVEHRHGRCKIYFVSRRRASPPTTPRSRRNCPMFRNFSPRPNCIR